MKKIDKKTILTGATVLLIASAAVFGWLYLQGEKYYTTDNAKVMADLKSITSATGGELVKWDIETNGHVSENQIVGRTGAGVDIKSPITGIVAKSNAALHQTVAPSAVLAVVADTSDVYIQANIEETVLGRVAVGQEVKIELDAFPDKRYIGYIREIDTVTVAALSGNATSFNTSGTYTKVTQLIPIKIALAADVDLTRFIGTNAGIKIDLGKVDLEALRTYEAMAGGGDDDVIAVGHIEPRFVQEIALPFASSVVEVPVMNGQRVLKGETVVVLDLNEIHRQISDQEAMIAMEELQLEKLSQGAQNNGTTEANVIETAEENLLKAKRELTNQQTLYDLGASTVEALNEAKRKAASAERTLEDAHLSKSVDYTLTIEIQRQKIALMEVQLTQLKDKLAKEYLEGDRITCPYDVGIVQDIALVPGNTLVPGARLFKLIDATAVDVEVEIPENQIKGVAIGDVAEILPIYDDGLSYTGKVIALSGAGVVRNGEAVMLARIGIEQPDEKLLPYFNVEVRIKP